MPRVLAMMAIVCALAVGFVRAQTRTRPSVAEDLELRQMMMDMMRVAPVNNDVAVFVRLGFHDAGTFTQRDGTGGGHMCMAVRGSIEADAPENAGLLRAILIIENFKTQVDNRFLNQGLDVSFTDLVHLAGVLAVQVAGGSSIPFRYGRLDCIDAIALPITGVLCDPELAPQCAKDGRGRGCNPGFRGDIENCQNGPGRGCQCDLECWQALHSHLVNDVFGRIGAWDCSGLFQPNTNSCCRGGQGCTGRGDAVSCNEWVAAVLAGAHSLGGVHRENSGFNTRNWTPNPTQFSNDYWGILVGSQWLQWDESPSVLRHQSCVNTGGQTVCYLLSDVDNLFWDGSFNFQGRFPNMKDLSICYANSNAKFQEDFANIYGQLIHFGHPNLAFAGGVVPTTVPTSPPAETSPPEGECDVLTITGRAGNFNTAFQGDYSVSARNFHNDANVYTCVAGPGAGVDPVFGLYWNRFVGGWVLGQAFGDDVATDRDGRSFTAQMAAPKPTAWPGDVSGGVWSVFGNDNAFVPDAAVTTTCLD